MTLKFESEILFDLMKRDGDDAPSDVLPYESELKEKYLNQVVGAYPKLQDYRPEWLNYNLYHHIPSDFPVESVTNVTSASFHDVVPYAYGSAILKGQTLVNLIDNGSERKEITYSATTEANYRINKDMLVANKTYLLLFTVTDFSGDSFHVSFNKSDQYGITSLTDIGNGLFKAKVNFSDLTSVTDTLIMYKITGTTLGGYAEKVMLIPYQDGMENWGIPYFEGMQSVQMPVLTTTGKNLFDKTKALKDYVIFEGGVVSIMKGVGTTDYIKIEKGKTYIRNTNGFVAFYDVNKKFIKRTTSSTPKFTAENDGYIRWNFTDYDKALNTLQIEEGSTVTPYEPFKSNILTVNEDVVLRSLPNGVCDTLNLITGEYVQRIGELVLDGSSDENWNNISAENNIETLTQFNIGTAIFNGALPKTASEPSVVNKSFIQNMFAYQSATVWTYPGEGCAIHMPNPTHPNQAIQAKVLRSRLSTQDVAGWRALLQKTPWIVQYELASPVIKTVDLTVTDQDGITSSIIRPIEGTMHVHTSSQALLPLLDMRVPVEATSQNLMSFANIEEEEK